MQFRQVRDADGSITTSHTIDINTAVPRTGFSSVLRGCCLKVQIKSRLSVIFTVCTAHGRSLPSVQFRLLVGRFDQRCYAGPERREIARTGIFFHVHGDLELETQSAFRVSPPFFLISAGQQRETSTAERESGHTTNTHMTERETKQQTGTHTTKKHTRKHTRQHTRQCGVLT